MGRLNRIILWTLLGLAVGCSSPTGSPTKTSSKDSTPSSDSAITAFSIVSPFAVGTISGHDIGVTVPAGTSVASLAATFTTNASSVTVGAVAQVSGTTRNDFSSPVSYVATAEDGTSQTYTVTVTVALASSKTLTSFSFPSPGVTGVISGTSISVQVPAGTGLTHLVAKFATTGATVTVGNQVQTSNVTANDFTNPVTYVVTAADGTTKPYTVSVTVGVPLTKEITAFSFSIPTPPTTTTATGVISGTSIAVQVPYGTNVTSLAPYFSSTLGTSVYVGSSYQTSGSSPHDFTNPVTYTVKASDGTTQAYTVTVTVAANPAKALNSFSLATNSGSAVGVSTTGPGFSVSIPFSSRLRLSSLVATFATTGASVKVGSTVQVSGSTPNNFTNPVVYTVTAADGTTKNYTVTVTVATPVVSTFVPMGTFVNPRNITVDPNGNLYLSDIGAATGQGAIYKVTPAGAVTTVASGLQDPRGVAYDATTGNLYFADYVLCQVLKISSGAVSVVAGSGTSGAQDGPAATATFSNTFGVAVDPNGDVYVAQGEVRKISLGGSGATVSTLPIPVPSGSNLGHNNIDELTFDTAGNLYVSDNYHGMIRKFAIPDFSAAPLSTYTSPEGVAVDSGGNVFDIESARIVEQRASGPPWVTISMAGSQLLSGVDDGNGNLFVIDYTKRTVLKLQ